MVRYTTKQSGPSSENMFVAAVVALAIILFIAIVMWPSGGSKASPDLQSLSATPLGSQLNDPATLEYLAVLQRVKPKISRQLHAEAESEIAAGANKDDLAILVLTALSDDIEDDQKTFFRADVKYFDETLKVTQNGLKRLSAHAPQYCHMSHYQHLANSSPENVLGELSSMIGYESEGYRFLLDLSKITLEGVEDARKSPNRYGRFSSEDEDEMTQLMMGLMTNSQVTFLMSTQTMAPAAQKRALSNFNFCDLTHDVIDGIADLPQGTKKRMMGEAYRMAESGEMDGMLQNMATGF